VVRSLPLSSPGLRLPSLRLESVRILLLVLFAAASLTAPLAIPRSQGPLPAGLLTAPDEASALAAAKAAGHPVEALSDRTEYSQTFANPSGSMTLTESVTPVRARRPDGAWVPVDYTLQPRADGTIAPAAGPVDVAFSGGGTGPMARINRNGHEVDLGWPAALPAPTLQGATATYPDVLPGVDLLLTAQPKGFSDLLVVKSAAASRNPALLDVRLPLATVGVSVRATPAGGLTAVDGVDQEVFGAPAASMWDGSGASRAPVGVRVAGGELDLLPDAAMLADPATQFPVSIDPYVSVTGVLTDWTKVDQCFPDQTYWNGANDSDPDHTGAMKVGRAPVESGDPCSGTLWRTYFRLDTYRVRGKVIGSASFSAFETFASSCASKPADLYRLTDPTKDISSSTDWAHQPGTTFWMEKSFAHGYNSSCGRDWEVFDVKDLVADGADAGDNRLTLMLRAPDEDVCHANSTQDTCEWKKFDSGHISSSDTPFLSIQYNTPPDDPTGLYTNGSPFLYPNGRVPCDSGTHYINDTTPTMHADVSDPDDTGSSQPQALSAEYNWKWDTGSDSASTSGATPGSGNTTLATQHTVPTGELGNGSNFSWRVRTSDGITTSNYSPSGAYCALIIDSAAVTQAPSITSTDGLYPPLGANTPVGTPGQFAFGPAGTTDVAGYLYGLNTSTPWKFVAAGTGLTATVTIDPPIVGDNSLVVRIIGLGGNLGPIATYDVITGHAAGAVQLAQFHMNVQSGTTVFDTAGGHNGTAAGNFSWVAGHTGASGDDALDFSSASPPGFAATQEPVVDTRYGYTVSAWVKLDDKNALYHVLTQDGVTSEAFALEYLKGDDRWAFSVAESDSTSPTIDHALSDAAPTAGVWTHLVGVFCADPSCLAPGDTAPGRLLLYVDTGSGLQLQATQPVFSSPWMSTGGLEMGRGKFNGAEANYLNGTIDEVHVYWSDPCPQPAAPPAVSTCSIP
jgi:hypothetical protein